MVHIVPVILCGGIGSRLWPVSREENPKQFLAIDSKHSLFQRTILLASLGEGFLDPIIVCSEDHKFRVAAELEEIGVKATAIIAEPERKNTSAAVGLAAYYIKHYIGEKFRMLVMPSDHIIKEEGYFIDQVKESIDYSSDRIIMFGINPRFPSEDYGYIRIGEPISEKTYFVEEFVEKPNKNKAETYLRSGQYLWNSGIFIFSAKKYLEQLQLYIPETYSAVKASILNSNKSFNFIQPCSNDFAECRNISVDYGILEKSKDIRVSKLDLEWNDLGTWRSMYEYCSKDPDDNALIGKKSVVHNSKSCLVYSDSNQHLSINGVKDLSVIVTEDTISIFDRKKPVNTQYVANEFNNKKYSSNSTSTLYYRPWGVYRNLLVQDNYKVKLIQLNAYSKISLQYHNKRAEHWVITKGVAHIIKGNSELILNKDDSIYINQKEIHCIENKSSEVLEFIEVQIGSYVGEDDIVRLERIKEDS